MSEYNKLPQTIFNAISENVQQLAALFPTAVKDGQVDFAALREELGQFEEVTAEKYELTWAGKQAAKKAVQTDIAGRTLKYVPEDSKNPDTTENLYIEGDNLEVLKLLRQNYYGAIKMIYIDPPYNTGNDFVYRDYFTQSKAQSDEDEGETVDGERMIANQKSSNRFHATWLNMMYPRLRVAKDLLRNDGVIFISIDDNEVAQLRKLCDEIFGEMNFRNSIQTRRYDKNINRQFMDNGLGSMNVGLEHILVYTKSQDTLLTPVFRESSEERATHGYWKGFWNSADRPTMRYDVLGVLPATGQWKWKKELADEALKNYSEYMKSHANKMTIEEYWESTGKEKRFLRRNPNGKGMNMGVEHWVAPASGILRTSNWSDLLASKPTGVDVPFDSPKNTEVIIELLRLSGAEDTDIVLDFFSGSATTAHAVMQLNAEDGGNRKYIMVQYPETTDNAEYPTICELGKERIRRAGEKIKADIEDANRQVKLGEEPKAVPDIGFRVFRTADTNIRWTHEALKDGQMELNESMLSDKEKLDFMPGFTDIDVVYEVLLRQRDIPLSAKVERTSIGTRTYLFADAYIVCLDDDVTRDMVEQLAAIEPTPIKYVFRDSAFNDDISLKDETVRRLSAYIARNSGDNKRTYTVEFI